jgi:hypothetical protein
MIVFNDVSQGASALVYHSPIIIEHRASFFEFRIITVCIFKMLNSARNVFLFSQENKPLVRKFSPGSFHRNYIRSLDT